VTAACHFERKGRACAALMEFSGGYYGAGSDSDYWYWKGLFVENKADI